MERHGPPHFLSRQRGRRILWARRSRFAAGPGAPITLDLVLFDARFIECRSFAAAARRLGRQTVAFDGDITRVWHDTLRPRWAAGCGAIGGITTPSGLFCLEQLAKDHWRRVLVRIEHRQARPIADPTVPVETALISWVIS